MWLWDMWGVLWAVGHLVSVVATPLEPAPPSPQGLSLTPFVRHWRPAHYEPVLPSCHRRRRYAPEPTTPPSPQPLTLSFHAHNREFKLVLRPDPSSVFADGVQFHSSSGEVDYNTALVYSGKLEGDDSSHVYGIITSDGLFDGTIWTPTEEYYVEPLSRYNVDHPSMHSVIYRKSDVQHPHENNEGTPCASHLLHVKRTLGNNAELFNFTEHRTSKDATSNDTTEDLRSEIHRRKKRWLPEDEMQDDQPKKNPELPLDLDFPYTSNGDPFDSKLSTRKPKTKIDKSNLITKVRLDSEESRPKPKTHVEVIKSKPGVGVISKDIVKKEPVVYSVLTANASDDGRHVNKRATVDPKKTTCLVYLQADHMFYQRYGSEEACIEVMTRHVQKVNAIYKVTDFNLDGKPDNITFMIKRIKVHTLDALKDPAYRFPNNYGVEKYLELFSEEDYDAFCLAYMFTYRDFEMGTLGLAWTGDLKNAGGVCEKNGHYRGSMKSLNTGIVTLLNYGKHVPPAVSHVTLAHEIGHNFGSPHDPEMCTPFGEDGNYIMFARATSGDRKNNNKFSPCSLKSIDPVLNNKARSPKGCFTEPQPAICGNGVVEEGEECDCGWASECTDVCCRPQAARPLYKPCTLTEHSVCSPSQGPCCTASCTLKFGDKCRSDNGCRDAAHCDGKRAACPSSRHKPNRTRCDKELVCYMGECTGSICLAYGLESCQCSPRSDDPRSACELCCRKPGGQCLSSFHWNTAPYDVPDMYAKPGTPCNDYNGYCDVFQKCREVDPSGPLATLRKLLLSDESIAGFKRWMLRHWYAVLLILLAVIALLVASTRFFGRHGKKLKSVTIIHSSTTETVRLPDAADQGLIVHTAIRSKVPLKKKVALRTRAYRNKKDLKNKQGDKAPLSDGAKKRKPTSQVKHEEPQKVIKETTAIVTSPEGKSPKHVILSKHKNKVKKRKMKLKKETIDYSSMQKHSASPTKDSEALSKVQKWLLSSPQPTVIPKSKSIPLGLTERSHRPTSKGPRKTRPSKSATNLLSGEKARLQVVFKPPFRFSVKICKSDKTKVVLDKSSKPDIERKRHEAAAQHPPADPKLNTFSRTKPHNAARLENTPSNASTGEKTQHQDKGSHGYENLLPRSASDCKLTKQMSDVNLRHKKSNSVGQRKGTTESKQNLICHEDNDSAHLYENVTSPETLAPKSCSMPRRQHGTAIARQSSYGHLPRAQPRPHRRSATSLAAAEPDLDHFYSVIASLRRDGRAHTNTASSSASNRTNTNRPAGRSSRQNSSVEAPTRSNPASPSKLKRQASEAEITKQQCDGGVRGFQLVVGKEKLKRQMSDNELCKSRVQLAMPMSAGAEPRQPFCWNKRASLDCEASLPGAARPAGSRLANKRTYTFGELKNSVPNATSPPPDDVHISPEDFLKIIDN
ncbi:uncharacterized protein LOC101747087 [Bombyx mori]|uniref:ADAM10 endopeptidase n=1 Tax=Bombyx mori TaxID=7091 RepID=A0A8R2QTS1_BOMMO|nr:uncharacterized protein LOC101747087 [Bombyx mori]XP_037868772.1 uncharacterized protein LOC101747087 [Bombyx mori]XP_037868773.1 uncharacterized protein LOC101747087 [Bombyx mori]